MTEVLSNEVAREEINMLRGRRLILEELIAARGWQEYQLLLARAEETMFANAKQLTRDIMTVEDTAALSQMMQQARLYERVRNLAEVEIANINYTIATLTEALEAQENA